MSDAPGAALVAAEILVARRIRGEKGPRLPESCRPTSIVQALDIQTAVSNVWCKVMDDSIGGWKCSLPGEDKTIIGPIYTSTINTIPPTALWPASGKRTRESCARVEPELAFIFGEDLPARAQPYTPADVDAAIARTHLALELINSRYETPASATFPEMLADGLVNQGLFIGPEVDAVNTQQASEIALRVECANGESSEYQGCHPNIHPRAPVYWLAEFLRSRGQGIQAGQAVITGSYAGVLEVPLNTDIRIHYTGLGTLTVSFTAKA